MKRDVIVQKLAGIETRLRERKLKRRLILAQSIERRRKGQTREYSITKEKRA